MIISGNNITDFTVYRFNFKPIIEPAIGWVKVSNGGYKSVDRGSTEDVYMSEIEFYGKEAEIDNIITQFNNSRVSTDNKLFLSEFNEKDDILFGANINYYLGVYVIVLEIGKKKQQNLKTFEVSAKLMLVPNYTYVGTPQQPSIYHLFTGYSGYSLFESKYNIYYENGSTFHNFDNDSGIFEGNFLMTLTEVRNFRSLLFSSIRGGYMTLTDKMGVDAIFGPTRQIVYPINVNILEFEDEPQNHNFWKIKIKLVEYKS